MEYLSLALSSIAILFSLINLVYLIYTNKKRLEIKIRNYSCDKVHTRRERPYFFLINTEFINKSRQPIAITNIQIVDGIKTHEIELEEQKFAEKTRTVGKEIIECEKFLSAEFPINLTGLVAIKKVLIMYAESDFQNEEVKIIISTNRGKIKEKINIKELYRDWATSIGNHVSLK